MVNVQDSLKNRQLKYSINKMANINITSTSIFKAPPLSKSCLRPCIYIYIYKRASLACAARPEAPFGRLEVTLVNYKGDIISKYVHLNFKIEITRKITKFVNF